MSKVRPVTSNFNLEQLNTAELSEHLAATIEAKSSMFIFGRRGSGKTEISKQEIEKAGCREVYLNLSLFERTDLGGYPNLLTARENNKKFIDFLLPQFCEPMLDDGKPVVALLDEVDKADESIWAPLFEFVQFFKIGGNHMKNLSSIIMTGNLILEGGKKPPPPLLDRAEKYTLVADVFHWLEYAAKLGTVHPSVITFISDNPDLLFGNVDLEDNYADESPRGWIHSSNLINFGESKGWDNKMILKKVAGRVGKSAAIMFEHYFSYYSELLPVINDLYENKNILPKFNSLELTKKFIFASIACNRLSVLIDSSINNNGPFPTNAASTVGKFLLEIDPELSQSSMKNGLGASRVYNSGLHNNVFFKKLLDQNTKIINGA